jgi:hypothetical protein
MGHPPHQLKFEPIQPINPTQESTDEPSHSENSTINHDELGILTEPQKKKRKLSNDQPKTVPIPSDTEMSESKSARQLANKRNDQRLKAGVEANIKLLGKSTTKFLEIQDCIPPPIHLPEHKRTKNPDFLNKIRKILNTPSKQFQRPPFKLNMHEDSIQFNTHVLRNNNFDLDKIIKNSFSICTPGAEFRDVSTLHDLYNNHPLWTFASEILQHGAKIHLTHEPNNEQQITENTALINLRNHKKSKLLPDVIRKSITTDIEYGYALPIDINIINEIPGAMVCPLGVAEQSTLAANGSRIQKHRLTHDQTFCLFRLERIRK